MMAMLAQQIYFGIYHRVFATAIQVAIVYNEYFHAGQDAVGELQSYVAAGQAQ